MKVTSLGAAAARALLGALPLALAAVTPVLAQTAPPAAPGFSAGDALRQSDETRREAPRRPAGAPVLPSLVEPPFTLKDKEKILIRRFELQGDSPLPEADIRPLLAPYENRSLTLADIYEAADKITNFYRERGYLVAKTYVPVQDARKGTLKLKIVPGKHGTIEVKNDSLVRSDYVRGVIDHALAGSTYIQREQLERAMLLTSDLAGGGMPRVAIEPGKQPETSNFLFNVPPGRRVDGYALYDNFGPRWLGENRTSAGLNLNSPLGYGDRLSGFGVVSEDRGIINGRVAYAFPVGYSGLRAEATVFRVNYSLGYIFEPLDATGTADGVSGTLAYPVLRSPAHSLYLSGNYTYKNLEDKVLGIPTSNRRLDSGTAALTHDMNTSIFGLPLQTSTVLSVTFGYLDIADPIQRAANIAGIGTVGSYQRGNLLFNGTLGLTDRLSFATTARAQRTFSGSLDGSEQLSITGFWGVKSFYEGVTGDSSYLVTPELRYALPDIQNYRHSVNVFTDIGAAWLSNSIFSTLPSYTQLSDVGAGYTGSYEYLPGRAILLKAMVAWTYGSKNSAPFYDNGTKALVQVGFTF